MKQAIEKIKSCMERSIQQQGNNKTIYECEKCEDTEWIFSKDENGYDVARHCTCWEKKQAIRLMAASGISEEDSLKGFRNFLTFDEKPLEAAKKTAMDYYLQFDKNKATRVNSLLICGASGRGKTTLGLAVVNNLINKKQLGVRYMPYRDEITRLKQEITDEHTYNEHMYRLKAATVLFIDDMLKGKITESDLNILYEIVNYRYLARLPLIISTEKTTEDLLNFDEAVGSRLIEMSKGYIIQFDSNTPNYRLR